MREFGRSHSRPGDPRVDYQTAQPNSVHPEAERELAVSGVRKISGELEAGRNQAERYFVKLAPAEIIQVYGRPVPPNRRQKQSPIQNFRKLAASAVQITSQDFASQRLLADLPVPAADPDQDRARISLPAHHPKLCPTGNHRQIQRRGDSDHQRNPLLPKLAETAADAFQNLQAPRQLSKIAEAGTEFFEIVVLPHPRRLGGSLRSALRRSRGHQICVQRAGAEVQVPVHGESEEQGAETAAGRIVRGAAGGQQGKGEVTIFGGGRRSGPECGGVVAEKRRGTGGGAEATPETGKIGFIPQNKVQFILFIGFVSDRTELPDL